MTYSYSIIFKPHTVSLSVRWSVVGIWVQLRFEITVCFHRWSSEFSVLRVGCMQNCNSAALTTNLRSRAMIKCIKTCAHLTKNLVGTQPVYEARNAIWDHFSFTWMSCEFASHYTFILLLYYIALIESKFRTNSDSRTRSLKTVSETTVDTSAKIAGLSLYLLDQWLN